MNRMKKSILATAAVFLALAPVLRADDTNGVGNQRLRVSYALGMTLAHNMMQQGLDTNVADIDTYTQAIKDLQYGHPTLLTMQEAQETLAGYEQEFRSIQMKKRAELTAKNKAAGEAFLATNKNNPGVITLPDGLQYLVVSNGDGEMPTAASTVTVNYRGSLVDGTEFDSSYKRGQPATFPVTGVIRGWTEALQLMKVGSKWKLFIPSDLAYGPQGNRGIPPNSVLIFDVELLNIKSPVTPSMAPPATASPAQPLTSDIIKVPSKAEMDKGAKVEVIKAEDAAKAAQSGQ
jgi:FKBP-type peptidyl-prolyl cis-trans isomerase FklB